MCGAVVGTVGTGDLCDVWQSKHVHSKAEGSATAVAFPWFKKKKVSCCSDAHCKNRLFRTHPHRAFQPAMEGRLDSAEF